MFGGVGAYLWYVIFGRRRKALSAWRSLAESLGLDFRAAGNARAKGRRHKLSSPIVEGSYRGRAMTLTFHRSDNRNAKSAEWGPIGVRIGDDQSQLYTRLTVSVSGFGQERLFITEKRLFRRITGLLGLEEDKPWQSGDYEFDNRLEVRTSQIELGVATFAGGLTGCECWV